MRFFLVRRKILNAALCLLAAAAMFYVVDRPAFIKASASERQLPIYCVQRDQKMVSTSCAPPGGEGR